ncbi:alpha-L-fucosidase [Verrucomicrobiaceae bacterium N1E253]|uniref:alpha-L-fucosidase n=1 Tax=Oceaniferula marina TaxID=2748318 RepID=A0A851GG45_9BACT|nr:alpha-L-fucosidase [Oceaniferula marina]NWK56179.1 alpha-L-fucosidase [Oceaniferula marina]
MKKKLHIPALVLLLPLLAHAQTGHLKPSSQPNAYQKQMINRSYGMFIHFGINTYSGKEWTDGTLSPDIYQPEKLDTDQWAKTAKDAGMTYVILVTKHHEGFCLWDSKHTTYDVASSSVKTDVVKSMAASCKKYGLNLGLYYSLWDRNWGNGVMRSNRATLTPQQSDDYVTYMNSQLTELLTRYGEVCELWFDGGWVLPREQWQTDRIYKHVKKLQPNCLVGVNWSIGKHSNPDHHAVRPPAYRLGQPQRYAGDFRLGDPMLPVFPDPKLYSNAKGQLVYMPFEATITINKHWFWHPYDKGLLSVEKLIPLYERCTAQDNVLTLNSPPNRDGLMEQRNIDRLKELASALGAKSSQRIPHNLAEGAQVYATSTWTKDPTDHSAICATDGNPSTRWAAADSPCKFFLQWGNAQTINFLRIREYTNRVEKFTVSAMMNGNWKTIVTGTEIGPNKLIPFPETTTTNLKISFDQCKDAPSFYFIGAGKN